MLVSAMDIFVRTWMSRGMPCTTWHRCRISPSPGHVPLATHGSGMQNGNLSTAVAAMEFINARGEIVRLSRQKDGDTFRGAVVHLGGIGLVTKLTLDVLPTFQMKQWVYLNLPMQQMQAHFEDIMSAGYSVSLFTDWKGNDINQVWIKQKADDADPDKDFYGAQAATRDVHPIIAISAENCTAQMGVAGPWYERMPHFRMNFTPSSGKELQSEYFVPRKHAVDALMAVNRLGKHIAPHLLISEVRAIDADDLWMSPCYQQPCVTIHFTWKQDWDNVKKVLPMIEQALDAYDVRPHWAKLFTMPPAKLRHATSNWPISKPCYSSMTATANSATISWQVACMVNQSW